MAAHEEAADALLRVRDLASRGGLGEACSFLCDGRLSVREIIRTHVLRDTDADDDGNKRKARGGAAPQRAHAGRGR
jgi:hypothetical protein